MWTSSSSHQQEKKMQRLLTLLILIVLGASIIVKIGGKLWIKQRLRGIKLSSEYSYLGSDYPESWPIERGDVLMAFENPKRYALDTPQGAAEWASLVPASSGMDTKDNGNSSSTNASPGVIHLGPHHQPYTISMLHQLRCLDIIRAETVRAPNEVDKPTILARHCLNYLRQMVTCRADLELESFQFASHKNPIDLHGVYECKDWEAVYSAVRQNQREHEEWLLRK